jgi:hypothetical protein
MVTDRYWRKSSGPGQAGRTGPCYARYTGTAATTERDVRASEMHGRGLTKEIRQSAVYRKPILFLATVPDYDCPADADL